jgi:PIN domain nuclease of toxin-antitoxin system
MNLDRLLLDTHVFLWWRTSHPRLKRNVRDAIAAAEIVAVSAASAWEAGIKAALGKLDLSADFEESIEKYEFEALAITVAHAEAAARLPMHHADPFDRLLIAQAQIEGLTLVTANDGLQAYEVPILKA